MLKSLQSNRVMWSMLIVLGFATVSCKKETPVAAPTAVPKAKPGANAGIIPVQKKVSSAQGLDTPKTDFSKLKDPFKPYLPPQAAPVQKDRGGNRAPVVRKDLLPIQSFDVTKFKVSGIIAGLKENTALVIDPTGKGYVVRQGMPIGNNDGFISRIAASYIEVIEAYIDDSGHKHKRTIKLTLPQKK